MCVSPYMSLTELQPRAAISRAKWSANGKTETGCRRSGEEYNNQQNGVELLQIIDTSRIQTTSHVKHDRIMEGADLPIASASGYRIIRGVHEDSMPEAYAKWTPGKSYPLSILSLGLYILLLEHSFRSYQIRRKNKRCNLLSKKLPRFLHKGIIANTIKTQRMIPYTSEEGR